MSSLTLTVVGVTKGEGVSRKSGSPRPYSFMNIQYLAPVKDFTNDENTVLKQGFEIKSISATNNTQFFEQFRTVTFPCQLELFLGPDPEDLSRNIVVDFKSAS